MGPHNRNLQKTWFWLSIVESVATAERGRGIPNQADVHRSPAGHEARRSKNSFIASMLGLSGPNSSPKANSFKPKTADPKGTCGSSSYFHISITRQSPSRGWLDYKAL